MLWARAVTGVMERIADTVRRVTAVVLCLVLAGIFAVVASGCAIAALWIYLRPQIGPVLAPLAVAGLLLVLAGALVVLSRVIGRQRKKPAAALGDGRNAAADPLAALSDDALRLFKQHKGATLLAAVLAGLIAGRKR